MNFASIRKFDIANGEGVRVSLFVSGCTHRCKGCFNEEAQAFDYGEPFTIEVENDIMKALKPAHISGLTLLGGEPMEPTNQRALMPFLRKFHTKYAKTKTLWVYTGCVLEDLLDASGETPPPRLKGGNDHVDAWIGPGREVLPTQRWRTEVTDEFLSYVDVLVDGPFVESLKNISLRFRGSSNQRLLFLHHRGKG